MIVVVVGTVVVVDVIGNDDVTGFVVVVIEDDVTGFIVVVIEDDVIGMVVVSVTGDTTGEVVVVFITGVLVVVFITGWLVMISVNVRSVVVIPVWLKTLDVNSVCCVGMGSVLVIDCACVVPHTPHVLGQLCLANASSLQTFK